MTNASQPTTSVVVVGAGPTGLSLSCALQAAGIAVRIVDAAAAPATTSRALAVQPRGVEVLERLGVVAHLATAAVPVRRVEIFVDGHKLAGLRVPQALRPEDPGVLLVSQAEVEHRLRQRLAALGASVEWNRTVTDIDCENNGATVYFDDGSTVRADWVVGADGAHSAVRKAAGIGFPGAPLAERFLLADVHADLDRPRDTTVAWLRGAEMLALFPLPGDDLWRLMAPAPQDYPVDGGADDLMSYLQTRLALEAGGTVRSAQWTSSFRIQRRLATTYRRGRVLLAGDAAHIHSPLGGQGMNTGLGDAENLAWKLALVCSGRADAGLLDTYGAERRPIARQVLRATSGVTVGALGNGAAAQVLRDRIVVPLLNTNALQRIILEQASQLRVSYRRGPLGSRRWRRPRPGDRIPNRVYIDDAGQPMRLSEAVAPQWALVGDPALAEIARQRLGPVVALRGQSAESLLVRPDSHVAWRGADPRSLRSWLETALGPRASR